MPKQTPHTRPAKLVDAATLHSRVQRAMLTVTKSCVIAMRQGWLTGPPASALNEQLCSVNAALLEAFPAPKKRESGAVLPFWD